MMELWLALSRMEPRMDANEREYFGRSSKPNRSAAGILSETQMDADQTRMGAADWPREINLAGALSLTIFWRASRHGF